MEAEDFLRLLAAIIYQEGGRYELKQESIDALGEEFSVDIPSEPLKLEFTYETSPIYPLRIEIGESNE